MRASVSERDVEIGITVEISQNAITIFLAVLGVIETALILPLVRGYINRRQISAFGATQEAVASKAQAEADITSAEAMAKLRDVTVTIVDLTKNHIALQGEQIAHLTSRISSIEQERDALRNQYVHLQAEHESLKRRHAELEQDHRNLKRAHEDLQRQLYDKTQ